MSGEAPDLRLLKEAIYKVQTKQRFKIKAYVILLEQLLMIWQLPKGNSNYSQRWKKSKSLQRSGLPIIKTKHHEFCLRQRRFWEHTNKGEADFMSTLAIFIIILLNMA